MKDLYYVALKLFLRHGDKLLITKDIFGEWDLPGGRIKKNEFKKPFEKIIERKVKEELGSGVRYSLGMPVVFMRHERREAIASNKPKVRIFAIGYEARYNGGEIRLGLVHDRFEWVSVNKFDPKKYFKGGWLKGVEEYLKLQKK